MPRGGARLGAGRKPSDSATKGAKVNLTAEQWEYLELWFPGANRSDQVRALLERAVKFWPSGPAVFR